VTRVPVRRCGGNPSATDVDPRNRAYPHANRAAYLWASSQVKMPSLGLADQVEHEVRARLVRHAWRHLDGAVAAGVPVGPLPPMSDSGFVSPRPNRAALSARPCTVIWPPSRLKVPAHDVWVGQTTA
jgi:hypothetical protein